MDKTEQTGGTSYNILIADNNPKNSELISDMLTHTGYRTMTAGNGHQVLAKAQLFNPDLVILDTQFEDISGYDVCRKIKANPNSKYALILFICSLETKDSKLKAFESGADDIIEKSFDSLVLIAKVSSLLRISTLRGELEQKYIELEEKNKMLDFQLKMSRQIQRSIMRDYNIKFKGVHLLTHYLPALDIGGDFYDLLKLNENTIGLCIGDVSGHGISAALLTTMLSTMVKNAAAKYFNPNELLHTINNQFCDIFEGTDIEIYATLFCCIIDTENKKVSYSNAGHMYPFFLNLKNADVTELTAEGTPIGLIKDTVYENKELDYEAGDILVFYTDGLSDAFYKDNPEEFQAGMKDLLLDAAMFPDLSAIQDTIINMFYDINASAAKKFVLDDVSLILCRFDEHNPVG